VSHGPAPECCPKYGPIAPLVGADFSILERDAGALRGDAPTLFASMLHADRMDAVVGWVREAAEHRRWPAAASTVKPNHHGHTH
jgi:hypothetical protein